MDTSGNNHLIKVEVHNRAGDTLGALFLPTDGRMSRHKVQELLGQHENFVNNLVRPMQVMGHHPAGVRVKMLERQNGKWTLY